MNRRSFLAGSAALPAAALPAAAHVDPKSRRAAPGAPYKLSVAAYSYRDLLSKPEKGFTLFDFIRTCAGMGADGVELTEYYFEKPVTHDYLMRLKREAHLWGQTITGTPIGNTFTYPPGPDRDRQIETYLRWLDVSAELGSPAVRTFAGSAPQGVSEADARRNVVDCLNRVAEHAAKRGVFIALENHGGVVAQAEGLLEIVRAVESPWVGVNLDTGNFHTEDPYADLALCAPYAVMVQYKVEISPKGGPPQPADFGRILRILQDAGYRGWIALEYEAKEDPLTAVPRHLRAMRERMAAAARPTP